ncbi:hypothetical protein ACH4TX_42030 [Streptomyces sp. NPDC021098]|uniref:hypothetical protein n=1 Tax=unclassified Streptomyces TaxID=2593676 RepID=UPI0037B115E4
MPRSKRERLLAAIPDVNRAIDYLREQDRVRWANAVETVTAYAADAADAKDREAESDKKVATKKVSVNLGEPFRDHVYATAEAEGIDLLKFVKRMLTAFRDGEWAPAQPPREPSGQAPPLAFWNGRIPVDLWDEVAELATDKKRWALDPDERVYKLTGLKVILAAFQERFPMSEDEPAER